MKRTIRAAAVALAVTALPTALLAQQRQPTPQRAAAPRASAPAPALTPAQREMQGWYAELMQIGGRLQAAQVKALQDPQLRAAQEQLGKDFKAAIERADPGLAGLEARAQAMEAQAQQAQQAGDEAKLMQLTQQAQQIQARLMNAQQRALRDNPALATRAKAFEEQLRRRMVQVEPQTMALVERGQALQSKLEAAVRAQEGGTRP
ncbi:MAG TPA: hypothetical protein VGR37_15595 [Longimicrobiaceae bacterium]|nr:hypothetical protein [Longimicrobiaceae bacterium]